MPKLITDKSQMQCTLGALPMSLVVTSQMIAKVEGLLLATEMDKIPMVNIPSFGVCSCSPIPPPCVPSPIMWEDTSTISTVNGLKSLTVTSTCQCALGGKISFVETSNKLVSSE